MNWKVLFLLGGASRMNGILVGDKVYFWGGYHTAPMWTAASYDLRTGEWRRLCDLKDGVSYPGLASDGSYIYILRIATYRSTILKQIQCVYTNWLLWMWKMQDFFYWRNTLYIVGGCNCQGIYVAPHRDVIAIDVSQINP